MALDPAAKGCPSCGERSIIRLGINEEMTRSAEPAGSTVEIVRNSDVLLEVGGVGCRLRYLTLGSTGS